MPTKWPTRCCDTMLHELQMRLCDIILGGGEDRPCDEILGDGIDPRARLRIYGHHADTTLESALKGHYPVVCRLVDERFFAFAAREYRCARPPASRCLSEYGADFPHFLADFAPCATLPYLADVARFEWALHDAMTAGEDPPLDAATLAAISPAAAADVAFRLQPSLRYVESPWPIDAIWLANQENEPPPVDLSSGGCALEIRQIGGAVRWRRLAPEALAFRKAVAEAEPLATAVTAALRHNPAFDATFALGEVLADGLVIGLAGRTQREIGQ